MKRSLLFTLSLFGLIGYAHAGTFNGALTSTAYFNHYHYSGGGGNTWNPGGNATTYSYYCCPADVNYNNLYAEFTLPAVQGNVIGATLFLDVIGYQDGSPGSAYLNARQDVTGLTGDAYVDGNGGSWAFLQNIVSPAIGLNGYNVTTSVQNDYGAPSGFAAFSLTFTGSGSDPNTSLYINPATSYLVVTTDAGPDVPEPGALALVAFGVAWGLGRLRRRAPH